MGEERHVDVGHPGADAFSFVGDEDTGTVTMYYFDTERPAPVGKVGEFDLETLDVLIEQAIAAKHNAEGS